MNIPINFNFICVDYKLKNEVQGICLNQCFGSAVGRGRRMVVGESKRAVEEEQEDDDHKQPHNPNLANKALDWFPQFPKNNFFSYQIIDSNG